jgi:aryl-alcohol dehydrogenase-like predicted oxidoreductase
MYGYGVAEETFAQSIKSLNVPRQDMVISTKLFWGQDRDNTLKN